MRYFIRLSYKGSNYHGWQIQPNALAVQQVIESGLEKILRFATPIVGCGRTDTGVHASDYFAHFDSPTEFDLKKLTYQLNAVLPEDIAIHKIVAVPDEAHARFSAVRRTYEYHIHLNKSAFLNETSWYLRQSPELALMKTSAKELLGKKDFECFSKAHSDVTHFECDVMECHWKQHEDRLIFTISANRFLRNMVRAIVGTLVEIGQGKISSDSLTSILASKDRSKAGTSAPACGLFLAQINYPDHLEQLWQ